MRIAEQLRLGDDVRSALFYALLLKDAGCSSNASRLSSLFAADDQPAKHGDEARRLVAAPARSRCTRGARSSPAARRWPRCAGMRAITQEDEVTREMIGTRCERGAEIARMLELPEPTAEAIRALDEHWDGSGHPRGPARRGDPAAGPDPVPGAERRGVRAHDGRPRRLRDGAQAARPLVRPRAGRRDARASATTPRSGARSRTRARSRRSRGWEPRDRMLLRRRRAARPRRGGVRRA